MSDNAYPDDVKGERVKERARDIELLGRSSTVNPEDR